MNYKSDLEKSGIKMVTCWNVMNDNGEYEHNHIDESGWVVGDHPIPKFASQRGWLNKKWKKEFMFMSISDRVICPDSIAFAKLSSMKGYAYSMLCSAC